MPSPTPSFLIVIQLQIGERNKGEINIILRQNQEINIDTKKH